MGSFFPYKRTPLVCATGKLYQYTYRTIIDNHVLPFMYDADGGPASFVLHEGNCGPHREKITFAYLNSEEVVRMQWAAQSTDLKPIENR